MNRVLTAVGALAAMLLLECILAVLGMFALRTLGVNVPITWRALLSWLLLQFLIRRTLQRDE